MITTRPYIESAPTEPSPTESVYLSETVEYRSECLADFIAGCYETRDRLIAQAQRGFTDEQFEVYIEDGSVDLSVRFDKPKDPKKLAAEMQRYQNNLKTYEVKLVKYNEKMKEWEQQKRSARDVEIEKLKKRLAQLESQSDE